MCVSPEPTAPAPRSVTRGAKWQAITSVDWLRFYVPRDSDFLQQIIAAFVDWKSCGPQFFAERGQKAACGAAIYAKESWDHGYLVELPGGALAALGKEERASLVRAVLDMGLRVTRIDLAVDFYGLPNLLNDLRASCVRGELCRGRTVRFDHSFASGKETLGDTIYLGKRGHLGAGKFTRVYDKGIEQRERVRGAWIRWETEFTGDRARAVAARLRAADHFEPEAYDLALTAFQFRERSESTDRHLQRRRPVGWYSAIVDSDRAVAPVVARAPARLAGMCRWLRDSVVPCLGRLMAARGAKLSVIFDELVGLRPESAAEFIQLNEVAWEYRERIRRGERIHWFDLQAELESDG